jgi:hypothetical protein
MFAIDCVSTAPSTPDRHEALRIEAQESFPHAARLAQANVALLDRHALEIERDADTESRGGAENSRAGSSARHDVG